FRYAVRVGKARHNSDPGCCRKMIGSRVAPKHDSNWVLCAPSPRLSLLLLYRNAHNWKANMRLTLLVTIDSVKPLALLDVLIHSLTLQTSQDFDVVFCNQTLRPESSLRAQLRCPPRFSHSYWTVPRSDFLGEHPLWDLYTFHAAMLDEGRIGDYLMSLHME